MIRVTRVMVLVLAGFTLGTPARENPVAPARQEYEKTADAMPGLPVPAASVEAPDPRTVADRAFAGLQLGLETGQWKAFFEMLSEDFTFWFPTGKYMGLHRGKAQAMEFFGFVTQAFPGGLRIVEVLRKSGSGQTFVFEFRDEGSLRGEPYKNRVAISLDVCGDKICGYREYFGSDGKTN